VSNSPRPRSGWPAITGLLLLSALPVIAGLLRLGDVSDPNRALPVALAVVIVAHIVGMSVFCLLGAFQFSPALRSRNRWHRTAGRVVLPAGLIAAVSSIPIGALFTGTPAEVAQATVRVVFGVAMTAFLALGAISIIRRRFTAHGAWLTRAYAIAVTGGTQALVLVLWAIVVGEADAFGETWLVTLGFVINSLVAEVLIRRRSARRSFSARESALPVRA